MPTHADQMFPNVNALNQAREIYHHKIELAMAATASVPKPVCKKIDEKGKEISYVPIDDRNPTDIAALIIDTSGVPEDQRDAYFTEKAKEIARAFYTIDEKTEKPYPSAIIPYIRQVYEKMTVDTTNIDWNDPMALEKILATEKASQSFATLVKDFSDIILELYPDIKDVSRIDTLTAKASLIVHDAKIAYDDKPDPYKKVKSNSASFAAFSKYGTLDNRLISEVGHPVFDARIKGSDVIELDALASDFTKKHFLGIEFEDEFLGNYYNSDEYSMIYLQKLSSNHTHTSIEQWTNSAIAASTGDDDMFNYERIFINGKSIRETVRELQEQQNKSGFDAQAIAGRMLINALTDGKSIVTMMQVVNAKGGKTEFRHQELKVDLDKLNEADKETNNYGRFRRFLDRIGFWKIQKFKTNKARDAAQVKMRNSTEFKDALRAAEDRYINLYNSEATQKLMAERNPTMAAAFSKLVRAEELEKQNPTVAAPERFEIVGLKEDLEKTFVPVSEKHESVEKTHSKDIKVL